MAEEPKQEQSHTVETMPLFGRRQIMTSVEVINRSNIVDVLTKAAAVHSANETEIDYLWRYVRGEQPILGRKKDIRPEINNRVVENHAAEIAQFTSGYFLGEPVTYVRRGDREGASGDVETLNDFMFYEDKSSLDKDLATWMAVCGVGYRMILPDMEAKVEEDESPFELDTLDPRRAFVVYNSGFGHRPVLGVHKVYRKLGENDFDITYCCYTADRYYEVKNQQILKDEAHLMGDIPIVEYRLNMTRMGSFQPAIPMLDAINTISSNRVDGVEQFVQSFLKFVNCDVETDTVDELRKKGAIVIKSRDGLNADVQIISQELDQTQTQALVDHLYDQVLTICGMPTTTKGGYSTSDTGSAVLLRDGWQQAETRARDTELLFKRSEKMLMRIALRIISEKMPNFSLSLREVECKFTRRQHDNLVTKTQALLQMLEAGLNPEVAISSCGLFNDPMDVAQQSAGYLKKWDYHEPIPAGYRDHGAEDEVTDDEETE